MKHLTRTRTLALLVLLTGSTAAFAQGGHGGGSRGGPGGGSMGGAGGAMGMPRGGDMGMPGGNSPGRNLSRGVPPPGGGNPSSSMRGGLQLGPPGRWWDDRKFARSLGLNEEQQKRMDSVFGQNRDLLISRYDNLRRAEARLESLTKSGKQTETSLFVEIDRVAQARAELEKANTHMLLQIRDEMTPEQIGKLEDYR